MKESNRSNRNSIKELKQQITTSGAFFPIFSSLKIDYILILEGFEKLEEAIGKLPIFVVPAVLPQERQNKLKWYFLKTNQPSAQTSTRLRSMVSISLDETEKSEQQSQSILAVAIQLFWNTVFTRFQLKDVELIAEYKDYFELLFSNVVEPVVNSIDPPEAKNRVRHSYNYQITIFKSYLEKLNISDSLQFFFKYLDGSLKNSLVHKNFYMDENELYYF